MSFREMLRIAVRGVNANRVRSFLTVLGILIGVASVIVLVAVGNGSAIAVAKRFDALGTNTLTVIGGGFGRGARNNVNALNMKDVVALRDGEHRELIKAVVPVANVQAVTATFEEASVAPGRFVATEPAMATAANWEVASGRFFDEHDLDDRLRVAVIGSTVVTNLFGEEVSPVGRRIAFNNIEFEVVGVLKSKGSNGPQDQDDVVFAPLTTVRDTLSGGTTLNQIIVQAASRQATTDAQIAVTDVLLARHPSNNGRQSFNVLNQASLLQSSTESSRTLTVLLGAVAAISLLVGGIGIMNIMLVTVTERTREIGIRKAVGAPKSAILGQFLLEAAVLGGIGGIVGAGAGIVGSRFKVVGTQPVIRYDSVVLALVVAVGISLFFGLYPANRAASMKPIDALRHE